jgi:hypothetical protein
MKSISIRISADDEPIGAFTLDPYTTIRLLADARVNPTLSLTEFVRESIRNEILRDGDYDGPELYCADASDILAVAAETGARIATQNLN